MEKVLKITPAEISTILGFLNDLCAETDRAAVILSASKLDILLYQILQKHLIPGVSSGDDLFDGEGPLSSFRAKIDLTYRLGLIDGACSRALHLIRKIRNDFAHEISTGTLNTGAHRDRVKLLSAQFESSASYKIVKDALLKGREAVPSDKFRIVASILPVYLSIIHNTLNPLTPIDIPMSIITGSDDPEVEH